MLTIMNDENERGQEQILKHIKGALQVDYRYQ